MPSSTLSSASWQNTTVLSGDLADRVGELKAKEGGELQVHGSGALARSLYEAGLIDELRLLFSRSVWAPASVSSATASRRRASTWSIRRSPLRVWSTRP